MTIYDYDTETRPLLTDDPGKTVCICHLCGRMYKQRPLLCLCKSNAFLQDVDENIVGRLDEWEGCDCLLKIVSEKEVAK